MVQRYVLGDSVLPSVSLSSLDIDKLRDKKKQSKTKEKEKIAEHVHGANNIIGDGKGGFKIGGGSGWFTKVEKVRLAINADTFRKGGTGE